MVQFFSTWYKVNYQSGHPVISLCSNDRCPLPTMSDNRVRWGPDTNPDTLSADDKIRYFAAMRQRRKRLENKRLQEQKEQ